MNIIIVTQDDVFYLGKYFEYFFKKLPTWAKIKGIIILDFSPFGKAESLFTRINRSYQVFGFKFFIRYLLKYIKARFIDKKYLIKSVIQRHNIEGIKLPNASINAPESIAHLQSFEPDLIISISSNQIFKKPILSLPRYGCINLHTALLPKYKGLMPTFWALKNNEKKIGVSVFIMDEGIDTGDIVSQKIIPIEPQDTLESLIEKTKKVGMDGVIEAIIKINSENVLTFRPEDKEGTYYTFPTRQDVKEFLNAGKRFW
jgi:methionyl-tRNA formyltransferase